MRYMDNRLSHSLGTLIGLAIGDSLGTPYEFWNKEKINRVLDETKLDMMPFERGNLTFPAGFYTDDTALTICLAESLIEKGFDLDDQFSRYLKWLQEGYATPFGDRAYGVGQQTARTLISGKYPSQRVLDGSNLREGGNGALMRSAPLGLYYHGNFDQIKEKALLSCYVTHNSSVSGWCCALFAAAISFNREIKEKSQLCNSLNTIYDQEMPSELQELLALPFHEVKDYDYPTTGYCVDTLRIALWCFFTSGSYEETVEKAIRLGKDTDTYACIAGALAGSYYGSESIPEKWRATILNKELLRSLAVSLYKSA